MPQRTVPPAPDEPEAGDDDWLTSTSGRWSPNADAQGTECGLEGLVKGTPERLRIEELEGLLAAHGVNPAAMQS